MNTEYVMNVLKLIEKEVEMVVSLTDLKEAFSIRGKNLEELQEGEEDESLVLTDEEVFTIGSYLLDARSAINEVLEILGVGESDGSELLGDGEMIK